jgi:dipeptidyl aminopeptidase/acylaminoacyl peptidase
MKEEDLLRFTWIADPQISPDGTLVAFTHVAIDADEDAYRTNLWLAPVPPPGEEPAPPRALTFTGRDSQPRWSPDGRSLAFVRKGEEKKPGQLHVLPLEGGEASALTKLEKGASSPAWSPDGRRIAFLSGQNPALDGDEKKKPKNEPARVVTVPEFRWNEQGFIDFDHLDHVWIVDAAGGEPRPLTQGRCKEASPAWSRDGRHVVYLTDRREQPWFGDPLEQNEIRAVSPDRTTPSEGDDTTVVARIRGQIAAFAEGPDGRWVAVGGVRPSPPRSYDRNDLLLLEGAWPMTTPRVLGEGRDLAVGEGLSGDQHPPRGGGALPLALTPDGRAVFGYAWHGASRLAVAELGSGRIEELTGADGDLVAGTVSANGGRIAYTLGSVTSPGDLWVCDRKSGQHTRLFAPNRALLEASALGEVEELWYPSFDGTRIQGWLVKPAGFDPKKKYPLILEIHGGPHVPYGVAFFHEFRMLAAAGYLVLYTNPRGSTSYGQEFGNVIQYRYPGDDFLDLMAGVDLVIARGCVDETRLGVTGGSGGGLLTNWIVTKTDRFAAAITQRCVADWASMYYSSDFALFQTSWFRGAPFQDPKEFAERSPATYLTNITTPLMVIHSEEDWRCPIAQGETMFRGLLQQGKPTVMVRFPGENHELSRSGAPSRRVQNQQHIRRWFDHWLQDKPAPEYGLKARQAPEPAPVQ